MIKAERLYYRYSPAEPYALEDLSFSVGKGEYLSIVGENGSGKSTLVRLALGLLKPSAGAIARSSRLTGYVPQRKDFLGSQFPVTVAEMLDSYRALLKIKDKGVVRANLERMRMEKFKDSLVGSLSGGQAQRVFIARALIGSPDLLILDEPSAGVDARSQGEIYSAILELNRRDGITVVSVEHNLDAAAANSTLIFHLSAGRGHMCDPESYAAERRRLAEEAFRA